MWALIVDARVAELTEEDPEGRYHPDLQWVEAPPDAAPGMTYKDGAFAEPAAAAPLASAPAEVAKATLIERINQAGKLRAVRAALKFGAGDAELSDDELFLRDRWDASTSIRADDAPVREALNAAGCDVDALLGPAE